MSHFVQPSHFTQLGDYFKISIYSQVASCVIAVSGRLINMEGDTTNFGHTVTVTAVGSQTAFRPASGAWWITGLVASVVSGTVNPGDVLVKVELTQGDGSFILPHQLLLFGYPDSFAPAAMGSLPGVGGQTRQSRIRSFDVANPAAGAQWTATVPAAVKWEPMAVAGIFTASAAVANRVVRLVIDDGTNDLAYVRCSGTVAASGVIQLGAARSNYSYDEAFGAVNSSYANLPYIELLPTYRIRSDVANMQGADTWTAIELLVKETIIGA